MNAARRRCWLQLFAALAGLVTAVGALIVAAPRLQGELGRAVQDRGLEADGLFYTENSEFAEAERFFRDGGWAQPEGWQGGE